MSRSASIWRTFAGEERLFRLPIGRLVAIQEKTDCGPYELHMRLLSGTWRIHDLRETILQGLIGGDIPASDAAQLMKVHFDDPELPKLQFVELADAILLAVLTGVEDEPLGEP